MADSGGEFLTKKSGMARERHRLPKISDIVIVEDENLDADRMIATLRVMYGYEPTVRVASTITEAVDLVLAKSPDILFLDDILKPSDDATQTIPFLRRAGYTGPIILVSGQVTRTRRPVLIAAGADDVVHKDDVDSVRLTEALYRVFAQQ
jgi:DNA-binding NarL/FixJ family response regulator